MASQQLLSPLPPTLSSACRSVGTPCALQRRAPYDQFLSSDHNRLLWDAEHNALDAETGLPAHMLSGGCQPPSA